MHGLEVMQVLDRLFARCVETPSGCWEYAGPQVGHGYGRITVNRKSEYTHRMAYRGMVGEIPRGLQIDHLCRNTICANPWHMEVVTPAINRERQAAAIGRRSRCRADLHVLDTANTYVSPRGLRVCRACARINRQTRKAAA